MSRAWISLRCNFVVAAGFTVVPGDEVQLAISCGLAGRVRDVQLVSPGPFARRRQFVVPAADLDRRTPALRHQPGVRGQLAGHGLREDDVVRPAAARG